MSVLSPPQLTIQTIYNELGITDLNGLIQKYKEIPVSKLFCKICGIFPWLDPEKAKALPTFCTSRLFVVILYGDIQAGKMNGRIQAQLSNTSAFSGKKPHELVLDEFRQIRYLPHFLPFRPIFIYRDYNIPREIFQKIEENRALSLKCFERLCLELEIKPREDEKEEKQTDKKEAESEEITPLEWESFLFSQSPFPLGQGDFLSWYELLILFKEDCRGFQGRVDHIFKNLKFNSYITGRKLKIPPFNRALLNPNDPISFKSYLAIRSVLQLFAYFDISIQHLQSDRHTISLDSDLVQTPQANLFKIFQERVLPIFKAHEQARAKGMFLLLSEEFIHLTEMDAPERITPFLYKFQFFLKIKTALKDKEINFDFPGLLTWILSADESEIKEISDFCTKKPESILEISDLLLNPTYKKLLDLMRKLGVDSLILPLLKRKNDLILKIGQVQEQQTDCAPLFEWIWIASKEHLEQLEKSVSECSSEKIKTAYEVYLELCLHVQIPPEEKALIFSQVLQLKNPAAFKNFIINLGQSIDSFQNPQFLANCLKRYLHNNNLRLRETNYLTLFSNFQIADQVLSQYTSLQERRALEATVFWGNLAECQKPLEGAFFAPLFKAFPPSNKAYNFDLFNRFLIKYIKGTVQVEVFDLLKKLEETTGKKLTQEEALALVEKQRHPLPSSLPIQLEKEIVVSLEYMDDRYPELTSLQLGELALELCLLGVETIQQERLLLCSLEKLLGFPLSAKDAHAFLLFHPQIQVLKKFFVDMKNLRKDLNLHYSQEYIDPKQKYFIPVKLEKDLSRLPTLFTRLSSEAPPSQSEEFERTRPALMNFFVYLTKPASPQLWTDFLCEEAGRHESFKSGEPGEDGRVVVHADELSPLNKDYPFGPILQRTWIIPQGNEPALFQLSVINGKTAETFVTRVSFKHSWSDLIKKEPSQKQTLLQTIRALACFLGGEKENHERPTGDFLKDIQPSKELKTLWESTKLPTEQGQALYDSILQLKRGFSEGLYRTSGPLSPSLEETLFGPLLTGNLYNTKEADLSLLPGSYPLTSDLKELYTERGMPGKIASAILTSIKENRVIPMHCEYRGEEIPITLLYKKIGVPGHRWEGGVQVQEISYLHEVTLLAEDSSFATRYREIHFTEEVQHRMITWQVLMLIFELIRRKQS